jgi:hypothetical protein
MPFFAFLLYNQANMDEQPRVRDPRWVNRLVLLGAIGLYLILSRAGTPIRDLQVVGNIAYLAAGQAGLLIVDVTDPQAPRQIGAYDTPGNAKALAVVEQVVYEADGRQGLRVIDASNPRQPREIGFFNTPDSAEDVDIQGRLAYVADEGGGLVSINIEDPSRPRGQEGSQGYRFRGRAMQVDVRGDYAYVGDNNNQLRVVNIARRGQPDEVAVLDVGERINDVMATPGNRVYLAAGKRGMLVIDVSDPEKPAEIAAFETRAEALDLDILAGLYAYIADGRGGLSILDISDLKDIEQIGDYQQAYAAVRVDVDGAYVFLGDRYAGLRVLESQIEVTPEQVNPRAERRGNTLAVAVSGRFAYLASDGQGLRVLDVSDPGQLQEVAFYNNPAGAVGVSLAGDYIYLSSGRDGVHILFLVEPESPNPEVQELARIESRGEANAVASTNQFLYLADGSAGLRIFNIDRPAEPQEQGGVDTPGRALAVAVLGDYAYVADGEAGLRVINVLDPELPAEVGAVDTPGEAQAVSVARAGGMPDRLLAFVADGVGGLRAIDVSDPRNPYEIGVLTSSQPIQDVVVRGPYAYLAAGERGMLVVSITDPLQMGEVGSQDSPGEGRGLAVAGQLVYLADLDRGLRVIDVSNPAAPVEVGFFDQPKRVVGVTVAGDKAYLLDGERGIRIEDISRPRDPVEVGHFDQTGMAADVAVAGDLAYLADPTGLQVVNVADPRHASLVGSFGTPDRATAVVVVNNLAYIAAAEFGLRIADISNPQAIESVGFHDTLGVAQDVFVSGNYAYVADGPAGLHIFNILNPEDPKTSSVLDQFREARSVVVVGTYAYLADGVNGLWVLDVSRPVIPQIVGYLDTPGTALDLARYGPYLFVADGDKGIQIVYILDPFKPRNVGSLELPGESLGVDVKWLPGGGDQEGEFIIYVARGDLGLGVLQARKEALPTQVGLYETPGTAPLRQVLAEGFGLLAAPGASKSLKSTGWFLFDILVLGLAGFFLWLAMFAQFALPLSDLRDRLRAARHLAYYALGAYGPAVRIENGHVRQRPGEQKRRGPGVVLLDTASAAMLRTKTAFTRPVGPGVVFTRVGEYLHVDGDETIDLHIQSSPNPPLGPLGAEDSFKPLTEKQKRDPKAVEEFKARQERRRQTSAMTRDGIEVVARIQAVVKLKSVPGQGGTQFGYNPASVRKAIIREGVIPENLQNLPWHQVPAYLAVDVWREYLSKFTLTDLFDIRANGALESLSITGSDGSQNGGSPAEGWRYRDETGLEIVLRMVKERLTRPSGIQLDEYGRPTGQRQASREFQLLEQMGIQVKKVSINSFQFPKEVQEQLVQQWISTWLERANLERLVVDQQRVVAVRQGQEIALLDFGDEMVQAFAGLLESADRAARPDLRASLDNLLQATQQVLTLNTRLQRWLDTEVKEINELLSWVRR